PLRRTRGRCGRGGGGCFDVSLGQLLADQLVVLPARPGLAGEALRLRLAPGVDPAKGHREGTAFQLDVPELARSVVAILERAHESSPGGRGPDHFAPCVASPMTALTWWVATAISFVRTTPEL